MSIRQLIDSEELSEHIRDKDWHFVDCRFDLSDAAAGRRDYEAGHIPGATFMDLNEDLASSPGPDTGRHPLPDAARIEATIGKLGIDNASTVVVYDAGSGAMAARAWWIFRWLGHDKVRLLDGGVAAWTASQNALSSDFVAIEPAKFVAHIRENLVITTEQINAQLDHMARLNLLDARDAARFAGEHEPIDRVAGHVPGARNLPFTESLNADGRWRDTRELQELWSRNLGDDRRTQWVAMCGSGVTACHLAISAIEAGYREPRLYVGSFSEWITDSSRPIGRGLG